MVNRVKGRYKAELRANFAASLRRVRESLAFCSRLKNYAKGLPRL